MSESRPITPHPFRDTASSEQYYFDLCRSYERQLAQLKNELDRRNARIKHLNSVRRTVSEIGMIFAFSLILAMLFMTAFVDTHVTEMAWLIILGIAGVGIFQYCYVVYTQPR